jgi:hypothetical protein
MARPKKEIDEKIVKELAFIHLPNEFIANICGVSVDTLLRRFAGLIAEQRSKGKAKLLSKAWFKVEHNDWNAIKFLLQNYLGLSDKVETKVESTNTNFELNYAKESLQNAIAKNKKI